VVGEIKAVERQIVGSHENNENINGNEPPSAEKR
jgi:hypothetical protein